MSLNVGREGGLKNNFYVFLMTKDCFSYDIQTDLRVWIVFQALKSFNEFFVNLGERFYRISRLKSTSLKYKLRKK